MTKLRCKNDTVFITEMSTTDTDCMCNHDLTYTLSNFKEAVYHVVIERQTINRDGKPSGGVMKYGKFSFTYSPTLSDNKSIEYFEKR